jgi:hypothetical protein
VLAPSAHPGGPLFSLFFPEGTSVKAALAAEFLDSPKTGTVENSDDDRCFQTNSSRKTAAQAKRIIIEGSALLYAGWENLIIPMLV